MKRHPKSTQDFYDSFSENEPAGTSAAAGSGNGAGNSGAGSKYAPAGAMEAGSGSNEIRPAGKAASASGSETPAASGIFAADAHTPAASGESTSADSSHTPAVSGIPASGSDDSSSGSETRTSDPAASGTAKSAVKKSRRKKRSVVNNRISLRMALVFFAFMFLLAILLIALPRPVTSSIERRNLATWPTLSLDNYFSGNYTSGITLVYDDTVPARDNLKNISNNIKSAFGISTSGTVEIIGAVSRVADNSKMQDTSSQPSDDPNSPQNSAGQDTAGTQGLLPADAAGEGQDAGQNAQAQAPGAAASAKTASADVHSKNYHLENVETVNEDGIIVAFQDGHWRAMSLIAYYYNSLYNDVVNYVRQVVDSDVNIYFMPIPVAVEFYCPPDYLEYTMELEDIYKEVSSHMISGIKCIDLIPALNAHNEEAIYLRTDHHWAPLGAYYAAKHFAESVNVPFAELDTFTEYVNEGYVGTMYAFTESANLLNDPEDFVYYVPGNGYTVDYYNTAFEYQWTAGLFADTDVDNSYSTFMGGDSNIVKVTTDVGNGRRLLVIKDSYGNAMIPCLTSSFEEIYVVDQRYFDVNLINFIAYNNITDVLFTHNYFCLAGAEAELLEYITYSNYDVPISDDAPKAEVPDKKNTAAKTGEDAAGQDAAKKGAGTADASKKTNEDAQASDQDDTTGQDDLTPGADGEDAPEDQAYEEDYYNAEDTVYDENYDTYDDSYDTYDAGYDEGYDEGYYEDGGNYDESYDTYDAGNDGNYYDDGSEEYYEGEY